MITLYSYPELFGVADNNGYGLKVFAFMRLAGVALRHEHIFDASAAPRGQRGNRGVGGLRFSQRRSRQMQCRAAPGCLSRTATRICSA